MKLKILDGIKSGRGLSLLFVVVKGEGIGRKTRHCNFTLGCVIYCANGISAKLLLETGKGVYVSISN